MMQWQESLPAEEAVACGNAKWYMRDKPVNTAKFQVVKFQYLLVEDLV